MNLFPYKFLSFFLYRIMILLNNNNILIRVIIHHITLRIKMILSTLITSLLNLFTHILSSIRMLNFMKSLKILIIPLSNLQKSFPINRQQSSKRLRLNRISLFHISKKLVLPKIFHFILLTYICKFILNSHSPLQNQV